MNKTIPLAPSAPIGVGDYDNDTISDLMVKFNGTEVISYIKANVDMTKLYLERFMNITLTITGKLYDGTQFQGNDTIRITSPMPRGAGRDTFPFLRTCRRNHTLFLMFKPMNSMHAKFCAFSIVLVAFTHI